ncbi:hypothetical protein WA158_005208 [Blastocystis sp. Blastoise]
MSGTTFKKLQIKRLPTIKAQTTPEERYWKSFKLLPEEKLGSSVTYISFQSSEPHDFCITSGTKIAYYSGQTKKKLRLYSRFTETAYSGVLRNDGMLLAAGTEKGIVKVFDVSKKLMLRQMKGHTGPVHTVQFTNINTQLISGGDDKTIRLWDITTGKPISVIKGHTDYVRTLCPYADSPDLYVSGGMDHMVKVWDIRDNKNTCIGTGAHAECVDFVYSAQGNKYIYTASGPSVYIWDIMNMAQPIHVITKHTQAVTSLAIYKNNLLSAGLDSMVKVYDTVSYDLQTELKYPAPLLSLAVSPDGTGLVTGAVNGCTYIKQRTITATPVARVIEYRANTAKFYNRGERSLPDADAQVVGTKRERELKPKMKEWDRCLKTFAYHKALDAAMKTKVPTIVLSVLEELRQRNGLAIAFEGREGSDLENLLSFFLKYVTYPIFSLPIADCIGILLDQYTPVGGRLEIIDDFISKLYTVLQQEMNTQEEIMNVLGMMESLSQ